MKRLAWLLALSLLGLGVVAARRRSLPPVTQWEYRTVWDQTDTTRLNALGRDGWELVAVHTAIFNGTTAREVGWLYFKRPLPAP
jgi:hypothetical protein